jgi:DNA-binding GntR family transcriptional regulator
MTNQSGNTPQYRMLYESLRKLIINGIYKEGSILPSENELAKLNNLTRPTVRRALDALVNDGYIIKHQGKGSIVHRMPKEIGLLSIGGTTSVIGRKYLKTKIIVKPKLIPWQNEFMFPLQEEEKVAGCIYMERLRLVNEKPIFYDTNFLPNINLPRFCNRSLEDKSLFEILRTEYQIEIKGGEQRLQAISADEKTSKYLKIKKGEPILHLERKIHTNMQGFTFYSSLYCNTKEYSLYGAF